MWLFDLLYVYCEKSRDKAREKVSAIQKYQFWIGGTKRLRGEMVVVLLKRKWEKGGRRQEAQRGVGMEVFRDSLWTDSDMGTHSRPNEAWPPLADFIGLG